MTLEQLTFLQADFLASLSAQPGSNKARTMTVTSGRKCAGLLKRLSPIGLLAKMLLESSIWHSMTCLLTWKIRGTKSSRLLFQLAPLTPHIREIVSGLLPTPRVTDDSSCRILVLTENGYLARTNKIQTMRYGANLSDVIRNLPRFVSLGGLNDGLTLQPELVEWMMGYPEGWSELEASEMR